MFIQIYTWGKIHDPTRKVKIRERVKGVVKEASLWANAYCSTDYCHNIATSYNTKGYHCGIHP